jgi:hypothetical protein
LRIRFFAVPCALRERFLPVLGAFALVAMEEMCLFFVGAQQQGRALG